MQTLQFIQTTPDKLRAEILQDFKKEIDLLKKEYRPKEPITFLTRNEVAEMLKVDISTVHNWVKKGKLISYSIGSRVYFKRDEVEQSLIELKK
jgi:excisionase family DNA binding protein